MLANDANFLIEKKSLIPWVLPQYVNFISDITHRLFKASIGMEKKHLTF
jgi:hypothetical protein